MTIINKHLNISPLMHFLIQNLPPKINGGKSKETANFNNYSSIAALKTCPFISYNCKDRTSIMMFDIDKIGDQIAKEYFKNIDSLLNFITTKIGFEPTFILEGEKGFHFGFGLKNHVYDKNSKAVKYLRAIKKALTKLLQCDPMGSHRLSGIWRNPLHHSSYFSGEFNYELNDFKEFLPKLQERKRKSSSGGFDLNRITFPEGKRNNNLFYCGLVFADTKSCLTEDNIFQHVQSINSSKKVDLKEEEIKSISRSVFRYWTNGEIELENPVNVGAMNFPKMKNLSEEDFLIEMKRRRSLSAYRSLEIRDPKKNEVALSKANRKRISSLKQRNIVKIKEAIKTVELNQHKVNIVNVARVSKLTRKTVSKYKMENNLF